MNVEILQISADTVPSLKAWVEQLGGMPYPLLSDYWPHAAVGKAYGILNEEKGFDKRAAYVLDDKGIVRYAKVYEPGTIPLSAELLEELRKIYFCRIGQPRNRGWPRCRAVEKSAKFGPVPILSPLHGSAPARA